MLIQQFEIENHRRENKNRASGIIVSALIHSILFLCLYFIIIHTPDPPYEDNQGGMTVNYGTSDVGSGDQQQFTTVPVTVQQVAQATPESQPVSSNAPEDLETQNTEDAPVVEAKKEVKKPKEKPNPDALFKPHAKPVANSTPEPPKPTVDKNALFSPGAVGRPNRSAGDGEGGGKGDQGDPNGDPNSKNYHGGGTGNGPGHGGNGLGDGNVRLTGRKLRSRPPVKNPCETSRGKVVISISVNRDGRVVDTKFSQSGSTSSDDCLVSTARAAAMKYTFDANSTAAETQTGSIIFIFKED
jgi:protein TonB